MNCCCVACFLGDRNTASRLQYQALPPQLEPLIKAACRASGTPSFCFFPVLYCYTYMHHANTPDTGCLCSAIQKQNTKTGGLLLNRNLLEKTNNPAAHVWRSTVSQRQTGNRCALFPATLKLIFCQRMNLPANVKHRMKKDAQHVWTVKDHFPALLLVTHWSPVVAGSFLCFFPERTLESHCTASWHPQTSWTELCAGGKRTEAEAKAVSIQKQTTKAGVRTPKSKNLTDRDGTKQRRLHVKRIGRAHSDLRFLDPEVHRGSADSVISGHTLFHGCRDAFMLHCKNIQYECITSGWVDSHFSLVRTTLAFPLISPVRVSSCSFVPSKKYRNKSSEWQ